MTEDTAPARPAEAADYRPDDEHRQSADRIVGEMSEKIFQALCDGAHDVMPSGHRLRPEDPDDAPMYDPEMWPLSLVDDQGRRFEVTVEVDVRPLPSLPVQTADLARERAEYERRFAHVRAMDQAMYDERQQRLAAEQEQARRRAGACCDEGLLDGEDPRSLCDCTTVNGEAELCAGPCRNRVHAPADHPAGMVQCRCPGVRSANGAADRYWSARCPVHGSHAQAEEIGQWSDPADSVAAWVTPS